jgi:hypothetical protein
LTKQKIPAYHAETPPESLTPKQALCAEEEKAPADEQ